jgi:hypothetical protein
MRIGGLGTFCASVGLSSRSIGGGNVVGFGSRFGGLGWVVQRDVSITAKVNAVRRAFIPRSEVGGAVRKVFYPCNNVKAVYELSKRWIVGQSKMRSDEL